MRIVQIGSYPLDAECIRGGVEASVYGLSQELSKNHEVFVIDVPRIEIEGDALQKNSNLEVLRLKNRGKSNTGALSRVSYILRKIQMFDPDICHIHGTNFFHVAVCLRLKIRKIPAIVTVHGLLHIEQRNAWYHKKTTRGFIKYLSKSVAEFLLLSITGTVIVDTRYVADQISAYRRMHKIWRKPFCKVIPQGIDSAYFNIVDSFIDNKLLSVGSVSRRKGHIKLIEVVHLLNSKPGHDVSLDIAGVLDDSSYHIELLNKIEELGLNTSVEIHTNLPAEEIKKLYEFSNIFVLHSEEESQGIVLAEAMACGKPVVATTSGGIPDIIKHGLNGFLSDYSDIETFADNIHKLLVGKELRKKMSDTNRSQSQMFSWGIISNSVITLYNSVLSGKSLFDHRKQHDDLPQ
jgi:1,2-diacylglycerol 3-alpha-glucosyltransferase